MTDTPDLAALIGSRICHDLISPIGAIGNGVELLMMDGASNSPEVALISESVSQANARIRFFRIAFGAADLRDQRVARAEILSLLADQTRGGRLAIDWKGDSDLPRIDVKLALLMILCLENALPFGGRISVTQEETRWYLRAQSERIKIDTALWAHLVDPSLPAEITPARVHFAILPAELRRSGRTVTPTFADTQIDVRF
jgi:histidine phosphotransferase ChpT